jgi:hypothetical protein
MHFVHTTIPLIQHLLIIDLLENVSQSRQLPDPTNHTRKRTSNMYSCIFAGNVTFGNKMPNSSSLELFEWYPGHHSVSVSTQFDHTFRQWSRSRCSVYYDEVMRSKSPCTSDLPSRWWNSWSWNISIPLEGFITSSVRAVYRTQWYPADTLLQAKAVLEYLNRTYFVRRQNSK